MGGINIHCGSFSGADKSGSAFEGVLAALIETAAPVERAIIDKINAALDEATDHLLISPEDAQALLPSLRNYNVHTDGQLVVAGDPWDQICRDDQQASSAVSTRLKYGEGLGWRAYCAHDLVKAFEVAVAESQPVALVW